MALAPVTWAVTATARQISERNLNERLALSGPRDELKDLADTVDGLLARLEAHVGERSDSPPTPPTNWARRWRSPRPCSTWPATIRPATTPR